MKSWSYYDRETGLFSRRKHSGPDDWLPSPPDGHVAIEGDFDHLSKRFDLSTLTVVEYQPPCPDDEHEWDSTTDPTRPRWRKRREVVERERQRAVSLSRIKELEEKQLRPLRELARDPENAEARRRLVQIDTDIAELRASLSAETETSGPGSQSR